MDLSMCSSQLGLATPAEQRLHCTKCIVSNIEHSGKDSLIAWGLVIGSAVTSEVGGDGGLLQFLWYML